MHFRYTSAHTKMDNSVPEIGLGVGLNGICWVYYKIERCGYEGYEMDNEECFTNVKKVTNAHIQIIIFPTKTLFRSNYLNMQEGWDSH
jgi:hypothetical protein